MNLIPKKNILAIDDEPDVLLLISKYLTKHGYEVATAATGNEGVRIAKEGAFRLIILDLVLPDVDGSDALETLRAAQPNVPVLVLSGIRFNEEILREAQEKGAAGYLTKALPLSYLLTEIHRILAEWKKKE